MTMAAARNIVAQLVAAEFASPTSAIAPMNGELVRQVVTAARGAKLLKPVLKQLQSLEVELPEDVQADVATYLRRTMKNNASAIATTRELGKMLSDADIPYAVFKGPARQIALGQDVFERPVADVDLIVRHDDFDAATALLKQRGFQIPSYCDSPWWRHYLGEHPLFPPGRPWWSVDLHHRLQQPSSPRPRNESALLDDIRWIDVGGRQVATLGVISTLLHTAMTVVRGLVNHEAAGAHALDLARQLHGVSPERIVEFEQAAQAQRLTKSFSVARHAAAALTGVGRGPSPGWFIPDEMLLAMLLTPDDPAVRLPRRRRMLWHLVDGKNLARRTVNFTREFAWSAAAEVSRRTHPVV